MANSGPYYNPGNYIGEVVQQALTKASTGTPQFALRVKILGTPGDGESYEPIRDQYERTIWMALTPKTIPFVTDALEHLGYKHSSMGPLDPAHPQHQSFTGQQVELYCSWENDQQGNSREKWRISTRIAGMKITPLESKEIRELDALFGKSIRPAASSEPAAKPQTTSDATMITDEDIPF